MCFAFVRSGEFQEQLFFMYDNYNRWSSIVDWCLFQPHAWWCSASFVAFHSFFHCAMTIMMRWIPRCYLYIVEVSTHVYYEKLRKVNGINIHNDFWFVKFLLRCDMKALKVDGMTCDLFTVMLHICCVSHHSRWQKLMCIYLTDWCKSDILIVGYVVYLLDIMIQHIVSQ